MKTLFLAFILTVGNTQDIDPFVAKIQEYSNDLTSKKRPTGKDIYFFDYSTEFHYWEEYMPVQRVRTKVYISKNMMHYLSNQVDVFVDENYTATVLKNQNKIVITQTVQDYDPYLSMSKSQKARNEMLEKSRLLMVRDLQGGKKELVLDPKTAEIKGLKMDKLTYICDAKSGEIVKTITEYNDTYQLRKMIYEQHEISFKSKYSGFKSVKKILFKSNGELQEKYKNYEIIVD